MHDLQDHLRNRPWLLPLVVFVLLVIATLYIRDRQIAIELTASTEELNHSSADHTSNINERLNLHAQFLRSVAAFASTRALPDELSWRTFSNEVQAFDHLPGIYAFAYARAVSQEEKERFTVDMQKRLHNDRFKIFPLTQQERSLPVTLISPETPKMQATLGFDLLSEPVRRKAIEHAIESRNVSLSGPITLINDEKKLPGFGLFKAVYRSNMPLNTVSERQAALSGIIMIAYRADEFLLPITRILESHFILQLFDDGDNERAGDALPQLLYSSDAHWVQSNNVTPLHHEIHFGNRNWIIHLYPRADTDLGAINTPTLILSSGLLLSLLISLLIFHQITHRQRAEDYAQQLTRKLRKSEERFRLATEGTHDGLWDQNLLTGEDYLSPRLGEIFGYSPAEMPQFVADFEQRVLPEDETRRQACLREHLLGGKPYDVEVRIRKARGDIAWIRIRGKAVRDDSGRMIRLAGAVSDITQLRLAEEELRTHRDDLQRLVEERTTRLEKALDQANQANVAKSEFLANMSHELRTPLHAIISYATLGQNKAESAQDSKLKQYFDRIAQSADRLLLLINDLLDLSKLESGRKMIAPVTVDLFSQIKIAQSYLTPQLLSRNLTILIETGDTSDQHIEGDRKLIEQMIHNLLANAVKYSPAGGQIRCHFQSATLSALHTTPTQTDLAALSLQIIDSGPGIPENELESIFEKFYQSSLTKTGAGGSGLGLAICRETVLQHHGRITAANTLAGGAIFTVTLPRKFFSESLTR